VLRIGLTGGIAAGKSVAAQRFEQLGARVVDHDHLARKAVEPGSAALSELAREFGDTVIVDGGLDRNSLAEIVFRDGASLARLNAIVHPYVYALGKAADRQAREDGVKVIVHEIPLLVESNQADGEYDMVLTVAAPMIERLKRLMEGRGLSHSQAMARIDSQATDEQRAAAADIVLDGGGSDLKLYQQVDRFWHDSIPLSDRPASL
jgi:dephospho-CoA kinase